MQSLGCFIDFVSKHSVTRPIQNSRELVVSHSASLAELPLFGNPLSYWASTNSCSEPFFRGDRIAQPARDFDKSGSRGCLISASLALFPPQAATWNEIRTRAGKSTGCPSRVAG